ncbi:hypothetical protein N7465_000349 [Penicillium sp. CMV-2018d]|nr:hypothetical protein N7465_000349 [Penicillium sp. CMV-2018d]
MGQPERCSEILIAEYPPNLEVHHASEWNSLHDWMVSTVASRIRPAPVTLSVSRSQSRRAKNRFTR